MNDDSSAPAVGLLAARPVAAPALSPLSILAWLAFVAGVVWRVAWVLIVHPPWPDAQFPQNDFVYSDMEGYVNQALELLAPEGPSFPHQALYPPGNAAWLAFWVWLTGSWRAAAVANLVLSCLTPLLLAVTVRLLFGATAGYLALMFCSLYFQQIDQAGYYLAETPFTFCLAASAAALVLGCRSTRPVWRHLWFLLGGLSAGAGLVIKGQMLFPLLLWGGFLARLAWRRPELRSGLGVAILAAALAIAPASLRATRLSGGQFCLVSNNPGMNFLMGHHGWDHTLFRWQWQDALQRSWFFEFGAPGAVQKLGISPQQTITFDFPVTDQRANLAAAWRWIREHPVDAIIQTIEHPIDLFINTLPWPTSATPWRRYLVLAEALYIVFMLIPALYLLLTRVHSGVHYRDRELMFMALPLIGNAISAALFFGEPRYRIPFDLFVIALAAVYYAGDWRNALLPRSRLPRLHDET